MRRLLLVPAAAVLLVAGLAVPASASHPCHAGEPCTGHTCIQLRPPFIRHC